MCIHTQDSIDPGQAAPMFGMDRFHVLDEFGHPACVPVGRLPIYGIDLGQMLDRAYVPDAIRCHRRGCKDLWYPYILEGSSASTTDR